MCSLRWFRSGQQQWLRHKSLRSVSRQLRKASESNYGRRINLHSLRHFFCVQWTVLGGRTESLARVAGFSLPRCPFFRTFDSQRQSEVAADIQEQLEKSIIS